MTVRDDTASRPVLRLLFWVAAIAALVLALVPHPPALPGDPIDKVQHAAAFAVLGLLGSFAYPRLPLIRLVVALSLFGALIEIGQATPLVHRDCDPLDWVTDTLACTVVLTAVHWWRLRRR